MLRKFATIVLHLTMLAIVCAVGAYWAIRIMTPAPATAPPPPLGAGPREADPVLAARMFGLVQAAPVQATLNVQAIGVFAAGPESAAVLAVDGRPARVYLLNQEINGGTKLVEVRKDAVTIERNGVRRDVALPLQTALNVGGAAPPPAFTRQGNTLSAPTVDGAVAQPAGAPVRPLLPQPLRPPQALPVPQPVQPQPLQPQVPQVQGAPTAEDAQATNPIRRGPPNRPLSQ